MYPRIGPMNRSTQQGQVLLIAVLLMLVILLTGILFVAIVTYNQHQSVRSADVTLAQSLAQAGIEWCDENLNKSPQGADWRPPFVPKDPTAYDTADPDTWPVPPVMDTLGIDFGTSGVDAEPDTEDDYYTDFERAHGWHGLIDAATREYIRFGYYRIPPVNQLPSALGLPGDVPNLGGKGHVLVRVTYDPDPPYETPDSDPTQAPDPMSGAIKIESIGIVEEDTPVFRHLVAYKSLALTDYLLFVTDANDTGSPASIGFDQRIDLDVDGWDGADRLLQYFWGPMRFNTTLQLDGQNSTGTTLGASTWLTLTPQPTVAALEAGGINPLTITGGYLRNDKVQASDGITEPRGTLTTALSERFADGSLSTPAQVLPSSHTSFTTANGLVQDGTNSTDGSGYTRYCEALAPPRIFGDDGARADGYRSLTRDSGNVVVLAGGDSINLGTLGFGRGVYVDNAADLQFADASGTHNIDRLINEWRQVFDDRYSAENSGWDPTYSTYTPPGVEIELFPSEYAARSANTLQVVANPPADATQIWWPYHTAGEPGIRLTRSDRPWLMHNTATNTIVSSGEYTVYVDYPDFPNQLIFTEGNARVHGTLPWRNANANNPRDYNLTVVSGGTIYVDGQILTARDVLGRDIGSGVPSAGTGPISDEYNSRIALLARDCVCLNTTQIAPQLVSGEVSAVPDDPYNPKYDQQHWEMTPEVQGAAYMRWMFGEPIVGGTSVSIAPIHSAGDPGPAAVRLNVHNGVSWMTHNFAGGLYDTDKFFFLQPEWIVGGSASNVETTLAPDWSQPYGSGAPAVPWQINTQLGSTAPGVMKTAALTAVDPAVVGAGAGSTEYRLKNWKVYETDGGGAPLGAIHAKVNAAMYAENGCWFVIPGRYFDTRQTGALARGFRRYNYDICVRGTITEAFHASPDMVREWCDKWAWPTAGGGWSTIRYEFDESLRNTRDPRAMRVTSLSGSTRWANAASTRMLPRETLQGNLPVLPCLPVSKELVFYGEGH